ncbi:Hpt domain-containing protein [Aestuariivirga sp.]|uniref:Hpt domain-containing protein n=1 Tax=Aestuariivirga sp. TaxID=2650926 RepID=UPI0039198C80
MAIDIQALAKLRELVGGSDADLAELIDSFLDEAPATMNSLVLALEQAEVNGVRRAAHTLKSNAKDMGAVDLAEISAAIEALCADGTLPSSEDVQKATVALNDAVVELKRFVGKEPLL